MRVSLSCNSGHGGPLLLLGLDFSLVELLLDNLLVVELVFVLVAQVDFVALLSFLDNVEINLDSTALDLFTIHFNQGSLSRGVIIEAYISKAL